MNEATYTFKVVKATCGKVIQVEKTRPLVLYIIQIFW